MQKRGDTKQPNRMVLIPQTLSLKPLLQTVVTAELMFGFLLLFYICKGWSLETNQSQRITAVVGDDVVLPCHLGDAVNPDELVVNWGRLDLKYMLVHRWFKGSEYRDIAYKGRTSLFTDRLKYGDASLRLSGVKHSDNGRFRCYNPNEFKRYSFVNLLVGSVSSPSISLAGYVSSSEVMLDCSSGGWYPDPEIFWLDGEGNIMFSDLPETIRGPEGLYTVSSSVTVEIKRNIFTCRVQQKDIDQTRETHIYVADIRTHYFFDEWFDFDVLVCFLLILGHIFLMLVCLLIWKCQQCKILMKRLKNKVNEEELQLITEAKRNLPEAKAEEELKKRDEEQRSVDQQIQVLLKMSLILQEQKKLLMNMKEEEVEKMVEENNKKVNALVEEVTNQTGNTVIKKAQGYLKLKEILTESNKKLLEKRQGQEQVEQMADILIQATCEEVNKLKERKQEIENHVVELKKQLEEKKEQK